MCGIACGWLGPYVTGRKGREPECVSKRTIGLLLLHLRELSLIECAPARIGWMRTMK